VTTTCRLPDWPADFVEAPNSPAFAFDADAACRQPHVAGDRLSPETFVAPLERPQGSMIVQVHIFPSGGPGKAAA